MIFTVNTREFQKTWLCHSFSFARHIWDQCLVELKEIKWWWGVFTPPGWQHTVYTLKQRMHLIFLILDFYLLSKTSQQIKSLNGNGVIMLYWKRPNQLSLFLSASPKHWTHQSADNHHPFGLDAILNLFYIIYFCPVLFEGQSESK